MGLKDQLGRDWPSLKTLKSKIAVWPAIILLSLTSILANIFTPISSSTYKIFNHISLPSYNSMCMTNQMWEDLKFSGNFQYFRQNGQPFRENTRYKLVLLLLGFHLLKFLPIVFEIWEVVRKPPRRPPCICRVCRLVWPFLVSLKLYVPFRMCEDYLNSKLVCLSRSSIIKQSGGSHRKH